MGSCFHKIELATGGVYVFLDMNEVESFYVDSQGVFTVRTKSGYEWYPSGVHGDLEKYFSDLIT